LLDIDLTHRAHRLADSRDPARELMRPHAFARYLVCAVLLLPAVLQAQDKTDTASAAIKQTLQARFKDVQIVDVRPSPVAGLYEVFTGNGIAYADATGNYLLVGQLLDTRTRKDLTAERLNERNAVAFDTLPLAQAIKVVKGNGKRRMAVFSDPDCPYCKQLEKTLASVTDVTVYTFLYPIADLHPDAPKKAHDIWCAKERGEVWTQWMQTGKTFEAAADSCKSDPIESLQALGKKLHVNSTPTLFFASGKRAAGALAAPELEQMLNAPAAPPKAAANIAK
jgi:thiol:disulfide interchange protein DsbC